MKEKPQTKMDIIKLRGGAFFFSFLTVAIA
jgi:hypothetical protein